MKNAMLIYLLAGCLYLFSCTSGKDYPIAMKQAMSCMDARPDSALALLGNFGGQHVQCPSGDTNVLSFAYYKSRGQTLYAAYHRFRYSFHR